MRHRIADLTLGRNAKYALLDKNSALIIPTIVLAEVKYISYKKRTTIGFPELFKSIINDIRFVIYPLDTMDIQKIPLDLSIHDGIIAGTALVFNELYHEPVDILTRNGMIKGLDIVQTLW